ncbi:MAG: DNA mismatch repair endonuclease MutL, partial [Chloroflexi bacterium]|nr:DNA mismatch repair endonuclease MutL [Chloroflexota bacterium]
LALAFLSHATSKISRLDDLERLTTLGFRGEALPSIGAVSRVEVQTRTADEAVGTHRVVEHGKTVTEGPAGVPRGTRISVWDLFANVPARRRFVRSLRAEGGAINQVVAQAALAHPDLQISLTMDGRLVLHCSGTGRLLDALVAVYGADIADKMRPIRAEEAGIGVEGMISAPGLTRQNRAAISIFVNRRPVQNRSLVFALEEAYRGFLMVGRHPLAAVHLSIPPPDVDVNIHPAKSEVRFARDREVHGILHRAAANALLEMRMEVRTLGSEASERTADLSDAVPAPLLEGEEAGAAPIPLLPRLPVLRVFGQASQMFIIAEGPDGLYMIDQHAAHERVLFDRFDRQLAESSAHAQPLLEPASVDLTPAQMLALEDNQDLLGALGFHIEPFGDGACLVRAVPALARGGEPAELVGEVLSELEHVAEPGVARERALAMMACKAAVKAGQTLDVQEMRELVTQLERTARPSTCPHGRPTMIHLSNDQLQREFGRG